MNCVLLQGLIYLHDSEIVSHGNFRSSNCLVDSRWVLQITDFGLHEFKGVLINICVYILPGLYKSRHMFIKTVISIPVLL